MTDYSILRQQIVKGIGQSPVAIMNSKALNQRIINKTANYQTLTDYSKVLGDVAGGCISRNIAQGIVDEELEAFAVECLAPVYRQCQNTMLNYSKKVQIIYNEKAGIQLNPVDVPRDESRIAHIIERFNGDESFETLKFLTESDVVRSITRGVVTDTIRENARFQEDAGLKVTISRSGSGCCDWCASMVGTYDSIHDLPDDFWLVHRGCTCEINYFGDKIRYKTGNDGRISKITE